jgi:iron complex outermembrane receptor protein
MVKTKFANELLCGAVGAGLVAALALSVPAQAQEQPQVETQAGGLEEILVTARKRSEDLQKVPDSVSAFDSKLIARANIREIQSITTRVRKRGKIAGGRAFFAFPGTRILIQTADVPARKPRRYVGRRAFAAGRCAAG